MPPPATGWRERLSDMYDRVKGGKLANNEWLVCFLEAYTFLTPARPTSLRGVCTLISALSVHTTAMMKSNVLPVPKAPIVSPTAAALLSVRFKFPPLHYYYCSQPITTVTPSIFEVHTDRHAYRLHLWLSTSFLFICLQQHGPPQPSLAMRPPLYALEPGR